MTYKLNSGKNYRKSLRRGAAADASHPLQPATTQAYPVSVVTIANPSVYFKFFFFLILNKNKVSANLLGFWKQMSRTIILAFQLFIYYQSDFSSN